MIQNEKVNIYYGTKDAYEFEKQNKRIDENALYFIEGILYSGYELYSKDYKRVTELPDFGQSNIIYINTIDSSVVIWDGDKNEWIYICRPLSNEVVNDNTTIATSAVTYKVLEQSKEYVEQYTDAKCKEVFKDINLEIENSIMENNRNLFLGTSDKYNSIADICDALDSMSTVENSRYTNEEIDNKFSAFETNIDWKEAVDAYSKIATTYPNPEDGWTVNVKDTNYTYRYNGDEWVPISANAIPKATNDVDGLLSKEDHAKYEEAYSQKHTHSNKSILDSITASYTTEEKTKLSGIATGANKTTIVANLLATVAGYALDATMGKTLYDYIRALQSDVVYLKYLANTSSLDFTEAKYFKSYSHSELGSVNIAYLPYSVTSGLTTSNKVIVGFTNGAVAIFSIDYDVSKVHQLGRTITWIKGSVPYVSKATIQNGTNTLALASGSGGYSHWDDELYKSTGEVKQTIVLEFSAASSDISVFYKIIDINDGFNSLSETETDVLM